MSPHDDPDAGAVDRLFQRAKAPLTVAALGVAIGLALAGSIAPTAGGVVVVAGWALGIAALHRLGRAGGARQGEPRPPRS